MGSLRSTAVSEYPGRATGCSGNFSLNLGSFAPCWVSFQVRQQGILGFGMSHEYRTKNLKMNGNFPSLGGRKIVLVAEGPWMSHSPPGGTVVLIGTRN